MVGIEGCCEVFSIFLKERLQKCPHRDQRRLDQPVGIDVDGKINRRREEESKNIVRSGRLEREFVVGGQWMAEIEHHAGPAKRNAPEVRLAAPKQSQAGI